MSCQQVPTTPAFNPYPRSVQVGEFEVAIGGGIWVAIREERTRQQEERRRERVLTARYPDKAAHDVERAAAIQLLDDVTAIAEKRMAELQQQRKALDTEMEFYQRDPAKAPMALRRKIAENEDGMAEQQRFVANQDLEKRRIHQRFDAELAQLRRLWATQMAPAAPASEVLLPAAAR